MELVGLERRTLREGLKEWEELAFDFRKQRFVYSEESNSFTKLAFPTKVRESDSSTEVYKKNSFTKLALPTTVSARAYGLCALASAHSCLWGCSGEGRFTQLFWAGVEREGAHMAVLELALQCLHDRSACMQML
eukprot:1158718-Pelagomonas_calceolata.AAC.5